MTPSKDNTDNRKRIDQLIKVDQAPTKIKRRRFQKEVKVKVTRKCRRAQKVMPQNLPMLNVISSEEPYYMYLGKEISMNN